MIGSRTARIRAACACETRRAGFASDALVIARSYRTATRWPRWLPRSHRGAVLHEAHAPDDDPARASAEVRHDHDPTGWVVTAVRARACARVVPAARPLGRRRRTSSAPARA